MKLEVGWRRRAVAVRNWVATAAQYLWLDVGGRRRQSSLVVGPSIRPPHMGPSGLMRTREPLAAAAAAALRSLTGLKSNTTCNPFRDGTNFSEGDITLNYIKLPGCPRAEKEPSGILYEAISSEQHHITLTTVCCCDASIKYEDFLNIM